jgi:hypothetical protein
MRPNYCLPVVFLLALGGCATKYAPRSALNIGGYTETKIAPHTWRVRFDGNQHLLPNQGDEFAKLRAADLCLADHKPFMRLSQFSTDLEYLRGGGRVVRHPPNASSETESRTPAAEALKRMEFIPAKPQTHSRSYVTVDCLDQESADTVSSAALATSIRERFGLAVASSPD